MSSFKEQEATIVFQLLVKYHIAMFITVPYNCMYVATQSAEDKSEFQAHVLNLANRSLLPNVTEH